MALLKNQNALCPFSGYPATCRWTYGMRCSEEEEEVGHAGGELTHVRGSVVQFVSASWSTSSGMGHAILKKCDFERVCVDEEQRGGYYAGEEKLRKDQVPRSERDARDVGVGRL